MSVKSTFSNSTSSSYASALYELAKENSELSNAEDGMNGLKKLKFSKVFPRLCEHFSYYGIVSFADPF